MNKTIGTGRNLDIAIENALNELGATRDEVTIKVISEGGLFTRAKVEVIKDDFFQEEINKVQTVKQQDEDGLVINAKNNIVGEVKQKNFKAENEQIVESKFSLKKTNEQKFDKSKDGEFKNLKEQKIKETKTETKTANAEQKIAVRVGSGIKMNGDVLKYMEGIIKYSKAENIKIEKSEDEKNIRLNISGDKLGALIGNNGDTMVAIEHLANVYSGMCEVNKRVKIDIGNYRLDKEDKLKSQAEKAVQIALKSGEYKFQPMAARERRIIHAFLQDREDIKTFSKGIEPKRFLVVAKKEDK